MDNLIEGTAIVKSFGTGTEQVTVLNQVSIQIQQGQFVSIMGPSGSGKSTLLYAISGMDGIDSGTVQFNQQHITALSEKQLADIRREQMGFVFQQPTLLKNLTLFSPA